MRSRIFSRPRFWLLILLAIAARETAAADEEKDEAQRWVPAFSVYFDALGQKARGSVTTGQVLGPPLDPFDTEQDAIAPGNGCVQQGLIPRSGALCPSFRANREKVLPDDSGSDTSITPLVGGSLELMTPSLIGRLGPRLFAHADLAYAFSFERNLAGTEGPEPVFGLPPGTRPEIGDIEELSVTGQGSRTRLQVGELVVSAGAGVAFSVELWGRRIRIKPSFEYLHETLDLIGIARRAIKLRQPSGSSDLSNFRFISLTKVEEESYDGFGGGLEFEADVQRLGPFLTSMYFMGRGVYLLGDMETTFSQTNEFGESATWTFEPDPWVWRGGVGIRFRWLPGSD